MRILMLHYAHYPAEPRARRAAEALAEAGHAVTVLCLQEPGELLSETVGDVEVLRVPRPKIMSTGNPLVRKLKTMQGVRSLHATWRKAVDERSFDVVHANNLDTLPIAFRIAQPLDARVVYDAHEIWVEYVGSRGPRLSERAAAIPVKAYWSAVERRLLPRVDLAITVNSFIADEMARRYKCPAPEVVLNVSAKPSVGSEPLPVLMPGLNVIYQGGLLVGRGLPELLEAVALVPGVSITIMGAGVLAGSLRERAAAADLAGRAVVLDPVPPGRVIPIARSAAVGVIPFQPTTLNNRYASPNKLFEYMHAGLAIVATDLPFIAQVLEDTGAGLTVPAGDTAAWAQQLSSLVEDSDTLERLRTNSQAAAARFSWDIEKHKLIHLYEGLDPDASRPPTCS